MRPKRFLVALAAAVLAGCMASCDWAPSRKHDGRTFYISPSGSDSHDGLSARRPWRTLAHADSVDLRRGDRVLLQGGKRFQGSLRIRQDEAGDASAPVVIGSYGTGRATIEADDDSGISVTDTGGVEIRDLVLVGGSAAAKRGSGVNLFSDLADRKLDHIAVSDVDVSGFKDGIAVGAARITTGFRDVRIANSAVHGNVETGLFFYGPDFDATAPNYAHEGVSVSYVEAYDNPGDPAVASRNTGSGIVLSSVRGGRVEESSAHDNGSSAGSPTEGPEGIWAYDSTALVVEHNVSYDNRTATKIDGGGFGLDNNVTSSVLQYNLSYGNDGPGFLVYLGKPAGATAGNTVRFNISRNDARLRTGSYGSIDIIGRASDTQVYNNTVVTGAAGGGAPAPALMLGWELSHLVVRNNVLVAQGGGLLVSEAGAYRPDQVVFQGNDYFSSSAPWSIFWGGTTFGSLDAWRTATAQERLGPAKTGLDSDPGFADPTLGDPAKPAALVPRSDSPLIGRALDLRALFGVDQGKVDYFGRPISGSGPIGAAQPANEG